MKAFELKNSAKICGNCHKWDGYKDEGICRYKRYLRRMDCTTKHDQECDIELIQ
jgi:hypothetical protein